MAWKFHLMEQIVKIFVVFVSVGCVAGTMYTVGDSSGWDISTDLDTWVQDKTFLVGDSLLFQFSSYHNLVELAKEDFDTCNTTNPLPQQTNMTSGNTTIPLTRPGDRFFSCGNSLHCLGGMKLQVHVGNNQTGNLAPTGVPAAGPTSSFQGPPTTINPPSTSSASRLLFKGANTCHCLWMVLLGLLGCLLFVGPN